jgi:hypothetical protein
MDGLQGLIGIDALTHHSARLLQPAAGHRQDVLSPEVAVEQCQRQRPAKADAAQVGDQFTDGRHAVAGVKRLDKGQPWWAVLTLFPRSEPAYLSPLQPILGCSGAGIAHDEQFGNIPRAGVQIDLPPVAEQAKFQAADGAFHVEFFSFSGRDLRCD